MTRRISYWLMKSEPSCYGFAQLMKDQRTRWDGVRNYEARNALRSMQEGDLALFYHSNEDKAVVGIMRIVKAAYADPTAEGELWSAVDVEPVVSLQVPVSLDVIRKAPALQSMALLKRSRLSVTPVTADEFHEILRLGQTDLPT